MVDSLINWFTSTLSFMPKEMVAFIISMVLYLVFGYLNKASFIPCYILNPAFRNNAIVILAEIILLTAYAVTGFYYTEKNSDIM